MKRDQFIPQALDPDRRLPLLKPGEPLHMVDSEQRFRALRPSRHVAVLLLICLAVMALFDELLA